MRDETLVLEIAHREVEGRDPVAAGNIREPGFVLGVGVHADALDITHHREAQRIGTDATIAAIIEAGLEGHTGMGFQKFQHEARADQTVLEHAVQQCVVPEGGPAFVHDLGLTLRIEILCNLAHDTHQFALPGVEMRRLLLNEIQQVLLRLGREAQRRFAAVARRFARQGAPQIVEARFEFCFA